MRKALTLTIMCLCLSFSLLACVSRSWQDSSVHSTFSMHFVGTSMEPTIHNNENGIEQTYGFNEEPQRGDIIGMVAVAPLDPNIRYYCKRVVALPGDVIAIDGTAIRLNGVRLDEPYVVYQGNQTPNQKILAIVPPNDVFVLGDNRAVSYDSRWWGFVPRNHIIGRVVALYYDSPDHAYPVPNESAVFALAAQHHLAGAFFTGWSGYYLTGNATLFLFALPASFPVFFRSWLGKRKQKRGVVLRHCTAYRNHLKPAWSRLLPVVPPAVGMLLVLRSRSPSACDRRHLPHSRQLRNKLTNAYAWFRTMLPQAIFLLWLLCSCSVPGVDNQTIADPSSGSTGASGASAEEVQIAKAVFQAINHERASNGIAPLQWYPALAQSARRHDLAMAHAGILSHQLAGEAAPGDRETQQGVSWTWAGENIGEAPDLSMNGAMELHQLMMAEKPPDDGHRQNILAEHFNVLGVDVLLDQQHGVLWLTEDFAKV